MIISDIHGSISDLNRVLDIYVKENCSKLIILGDLFNYGFDLNRNRIIKTLNDMKDNIVCVRGNCDNNIDNISFEMPYIAQININNKVITLTHGHLFDKEYLQKQDCDIILTGHTHVANIEKINDKIFVNPGSISKSRKGENSFAIIDNDTISIRNTANIELKTYKLNLTF